MKKFFKVILKYYLKYITKLVLFLHHPLIIAISGSTNKTFAKDEIAKTLKKRGINIRSNPKSFNTEIGLPLAILNLPSGYNFYQHWLPIIFKAFLSIFIGNFPKILVLELGVSSPGDMKYLLTIVKPKIAVITEISQRYLESFSDMDELTDEYRYLVNKINRNGVVILNYDNKKIREIAETIRAKTIFFSILNTENQMTNLYQAFEIKKNTAGQSLKMKVNSKISKFNINRYGQHHIYSLLIKEIVSDELADFKAYV